MFIWFSMLGALGLFQIIHYPEVLAALNPIYGVQLLIEHPHGFWLLGAVFLCTTGAEALYSDLGHCGKSNIRISWIFVKATLLLNYLGQGAWVLLQHQRSLDNINPFFAIVPESLVGAFVDAKHVADGHTMMLSRAAGNHDITCPT